MSRDRRLRRDPVRPRTAGLVALAVSLVALLTACSGSDDGDDGAVPGLSPSATATGSVSPTPAPEPAVPVLTWKPCNRPFECATMPVALGDSGRTMDLAVTRLPAAGAKIGSLLVNPGGPGASAVDYLQAAWTGLPAELHERFDLVAFDPRGVGRSQPVRCLDTAGLDAFYTVDPSPDDARERAALVAANATFAAGCKAKSGALLPYVGTKDVAADMELLRRALGDEKLTYLGYSYGTSLGAAYLDAYPTHVRAMVLDGALDPTLTWDQLVAGQSKGFDVAMSAFLADCQATSCPFRVATTGDLPAAYDALMARIDAAPMKVGSRQLGPGEASLGAGEGLYDKTYGWPLLAKALAKAEHGDGADLLRMSDLYLDRTDGSYDSLGESNYAVNCVDKPWPKDRKAYDDLAAAVAVDSPRFGPAIVLSSLACATWPVAPVSTPHVVTGAGAPAVVVMGSTRDPATPYAWSVALADQLEKAVLMTRDGDGHTTYRSSAPACLLAPVTAYLVDGTVPAPATC